MFKCKSRANKKKAFYIYWEERAGFFCVEEYRIYKNLCEWKWKTEEVLPGDLEFNTYKAWKEYVIKNINN